jgi:hypothetical protein
MRVADGPSCRSGDESWVSGMAFHAGWTDVADDVLLAEDQARRFPE